MKELSCERPALDLTVLEVIFMSNMRYKEL